MRYILIVTERERAGVVLTAATILAALLTVLFLARFRPAFLLMMHVGRPAVAAIALVLAAYAFGVFAVAGARRAARRFLRAADEETPEAPETVGGADAILIGYAMFGTAVGMLAWIGVGLDAFVTNLMIVAGGAGAVLLWRRRGSWFTLGTSAAAKVAVLLAVPALLAVVEAITPVNSPDELVYKLGVPHGYQLYGRMVEMPLNSNSYLTLALQLADLAALIGGGGMAAKLARLALFFASLMAVHRVARRISPRGAPVITAVVAFTPALMLIAGWCWTEWGVLGLLLAAYEHYQRWLDERRPDSAGIAFLALGAAAACKYTALPWLFALVIIVMLRHRHQRRFLATGAVITAAAGAFYYVRNFVWTGSPVAPLLLPGAPRVANYRGGPFYSGWVDFFSGLDLFDPQVVDEGLGALLLAGFVAGLFALRHRDRALRDLALLGAIQMPILLTFAPGSRNMINGVVPLAMAGVALVAGAWALAPVVIRGAAVFVAVAAAAAQTVLVLFALESYDLGPYLGGRETAAQYIARIREFARPYAWINTSTHPRSRVLLIAENRPYYLMRQFIAGGNHDGPRMARWLGSFPGPDALRAELGRAGVTHVLLHKTWYRVASPRPQPLIAIQREYVLEVPPQTDRVLTAMLKTHAILRYRDRDYLVFELRP